MKNGNKCSMKNDVGSYLRKISVSTYNLIDITYPACHVFSDSRSEILDKIMKALPHNEGYGLTSPQNNISINQ